MNAERLFGNAAESVAGSLRVRTELYRCHAACIFGKDSFDSDSRESVALVVKGTRVLVHTLITNASHIQVQRGTLPISSMESLPP